MSIDEKQVRHIAKLSRLELSESEIKKYGEQLGQILSYANDLQQAPTDSLEASAHSFETQTLLREDQVHSFELTYAMLRNAPEREDRFYTVPQILS